MEMAISVFDLFKIGIGPSSSHTVGPMLAALEFRTQVLAWLRSEHQLKQPRLEITLYGSLAATGRGHGTDRAVLLGLAGERPDTVDPEKIAALVSAFDKPDACPLPFPFSPATNLHWCPDQRLPAHPNGMEFLFSNAGQPALKRYFYSIGGGFLTSGADLNAIPVEVPAEESSGRSTSEDAWPFCSAAELVDGCAKSQLRICEWMWARELQWRRPSVLRKRLADIWSAMDQCIQRGLSSGGELPGGLKVQRRAAALHRNLATLGSAGIIARSMQGMDWLNLYALAVNEENAAGGRVVTAPTNGAAGIIPAVLKFYLTHCSEAPPAPKQIEAFLLTAAAIGMLCKRNASLSGAEVGCQGEVGSACAMAAAGLVEVLGGSPEQVENAAEIGLEHNLGLTCDPIAGLVQIPCIERNAIAAVHAVNAAQLALRGDGHHFVSLDKVIETMRRTGLDMLDKYKETSQGGLAVAFTEC